MANDLSTYLQTKQNAAVLRYSPLWLGRAYLGLKGALFFAGNPGARRAIHRCLRLCYGPGRARRLWPAIRAGMVDHYHEKLLLAARPFSWFRQVHLERTELAGVEVLESALAAGRGVILVTAHYAAVELIPSALALRGYPVSVMVHCKTEGLRRRLQALADRIGINLLDPKAGSVVFGALEQLQQGRILMTQCDEMDMWRPYPNRSVQFMGLAMQLDKALDVLARKSGAQPIFALNHRLGGYRYRLTLERPGEHPAAAGLRNLTAQCLAILDQHIRENPGAWYEWKKLDSRLIRPAVRELDENPRSSRLLGAVAPETACSA